MQTLKILVFTLHSPDVCWKFYSKAERDALRWPHVRTGTVRAGSRLSVITRDTCDDERPTGMVATPGCYTWRQPSSPRSPRRPATTTPPSSHCLDHQHLSLCESRQTSGSVISKSDATLLENTVWITQGIEPSSSPVEGGTPRSLISGDGESVETP